MQLSDFYKKLRKSYDISLSLSQRHEFKRKMASVSAVTGDELNNQDLPLAITVAEKIVEASGVRTASAANPFGVRPMTAEGTGRCGRCKSAMMPIKLANDQTVAYCKKCFIAMP